MILRRFRNPSLVPLGEVAAAGLGLPTIESGVSAATGISAIGSIHVVLVRSNFNHKSHLHFHISVEQSWRTLVIFLRSELIFLFG